jgi:hypothetical protein
VTHEAVAPQVERDEFQFWFDRHVGNNGGSAGFVITIETLRTAYYAGKRSEKQATYSEYPPF